MDLDNRHNQKKSYIDKNSGSIKIYHQNIRGLGKKASELIGHLHPDYPQALCITEHHLKKFQIKHTAIENYNLGASYCREQYEKGGVAIYIHKSIQCSNINIDTYCKEKDIEICAVKLSYLDLKICIITLYRSPTGNFDSFLLNLDRVLHSLYNSTLHFIICGDFNIDYLIESERKNQLENLLLSFNITSIISFPTRVQNTSATAIDNIFLDSTRLKEHTVIPISNGLSDHDAQLLTIRSRISSGPVRELKLSENLIMIQYLTLLIN